jgi:hypothetical protein
MIRGHRREVPSPPQYEPDAHENAGLFAHMRESLDDNVDENMVDSVTTPLDFRSKSTQPPVVADTKGEPSEHAPSLKRESSEDKSHCEIESTDDEHGFTMVSRPFTMVSRPKPTASDIEEPMSSPEFISTPITDILKATGSDYSEDGEWTML